MQITPQHERQSRARRARHFVTIGAIALLLLVLFRVQTVHALVQRMQTTPTVTSEPVTLRPFSQFTDTSNGTALSMQFQTVGNTPAGAFTLTIATGTQVSGVLPLEQQLDGSLAPNGFPDIPAIITVQMNFSDVDAQKTGKTSSNFDASVSGQFGTNGLLAYFKINVFGQQITAVPPYLLVDGCQGKLNSCMMPGELPAVNHYADNVVAQNWPDVYIQSAQCIQAQYTAAQFTTLLAAAATNTGKVTQITTDAATIRDSTNSAGQLYFFVDQTYTLNHNGKMTTQLTSSFFLFDGGTWLFWFSQ